MRILCALAAIASLLPSLSWAQEPEPLDLFATTGLGRPIEPVDARSRGMGGVGIALHGGNFSAINPASLTRVRALGVWVTIMPTSRSLDGDGITNGEEQTVMFPLGRISLISSETWTVAASFNSFLDQNGGVQFIDTLDLSSGQAAFEETRVSDGGVSRFGLEVARSLSEEWRVGIAAQFYRGGTVLSVDRAFTAATDFLPYRSVAAIDYSGYGFAAGAEWQPIPEMILGLTGSWSLGLDVKNDTTGAEIDIDLPITLGAGGSWQLTPSLVAALGFEWAGWSAANDELATGAVDSWRLGGGLEVQFGRSPDLFGRVGGRLARLPFELRGSAPSERALDLGLGLRFAGGRASVDAALEFGSRGDRQENGISESFTRLAIGLAVFSN